MIAGCGKTVTDTAGNVTQVATLNCIFPLIATLIYWALLFAGTVAVFMLIFGGLRLISSGGDPKTTETGKKTLTYAVLGLIVVFLSFLILNLIAHVTGVACLSANFPFNPTNPFTTCQ